MLTIIQSNRLDRLAEQLVIDALAPRALDDLRPEVIIVPNAATGRWLTYRIAEARGVCANVEFAYPAQYVWRLIALLVPGVPERSPFDANVMAWRILGLFQSLPASAETAPLRAYLAAVDSRASMALAQRIAVVFDDYRVHRGEWLQAWQEGKLLGLEPKETELWQAWVWRELLARTKSRFSEHPRSELFAQIGHASAAEGALPETINVFAVPLLPPLYLEILSGLARHIEVRCYVLNPCREYWADIVAERELARLMLKDAQAVEYREVGHPLLASWGKQARDNLALFAAVTGEQGVQDFERFEEPPSNTVLSALQRSMLDLDDLRRTPRKLAPRDRSIQVHVCHSLVRELEVLHDCLLHFFETHGQLQPEHVVVMTPDLDAAAPMIDAVFGSAPRTRSVPYTITGRAKPDATPVLRAFLDLLALPDSRFGAAAVMDLLRLPAIARRFELSPADLEQARDWLRDAGVRWGLDAETRAAHGLAPEARHTWAEGLSRMLLGYALPGDRLFNGLLPYDQIEGSQALVLGKLIRAVSELARAARMLAQPRTPAQWTRELRLLFDRLFNPEGADHAEVERIRDAIESLAEDARRAGFAHPIDHALVASLLREQLRGHAPGAAPTGAVTFCGMGALRGLPFRVVCVIGLADGAFPRNPSPLEFDLAARKRRLGDRVRRDEDRGAFLDALLAARDVFYLSYPGRDIRDNTRMPPSVLVSELLDYLAHCLEGGASAVSGELVTEHPLQPFSPRYFEPGGLISYSSENLAAARALAANQAERMQARPFFNAPLPLPEAEQKEVELEQLVRYLNHPIKFLLREGLGIGIKEPEQKLEESEPFVLGFKESWRLSDRLLRMARSGISEDDILHISRFAPELPHGVIGEAILRSELDDAALVSRLLACLEPSSEPLPFELPIADFTFSGTLSGLTANGQFGFTPIRRSAYTLLDAWVRHLALNVVKPESAGLATRWLTRDALLEFRPAEDAEIHLEALLRLYGQGIRRPVLFSGRTALVWIEAGAAAARERWTGTLQRDGENMDPWFRLLFGELLTNLPQEMEGLAREVFQPLFHHLTEISAGELARQLQVENSR